MFNNTILFCVLVVTILIVIVIVKKTQETKLNKKECMTLKTHCDVRDRDCLLACTTSNGIFVTKCFIECQKNSPVC